MLILIFQVEHYFCNNHCVSTIMWQLVRIRNPIVIIVDLNVIIGNESEERTKKAEEVYATLLHVSCLALHR